MPGRFLLTGEPLALDLVNTRVAGGRDLLETEDDLAAWLGVEADRLAAPAPPTPGLLELMRGLRADLRQLFERTLDGEPLPSPFVDRTNEISALAPSYRRLDLGGKVPTTQEVAAAASPARVVLAAIADSAIEILGGPDRELLRRCEGPDCVLLFVATNPRRRWCSPTLCGNRVRVARHYARRRANA